MRASGLRYPAPPCEHGRREVTLRRGLVALLAAFAMVATTCGTAGTASAQLAGSSAGGSRST